MLIRNASLIDGRPVDVRIDGGQIMEIDTGLSPGDGVLLDAAGGLLLPGLHDHHIHLAATAAAMASVRCGPPEVTDADMLAEALARPGEGWLRGIGYHESVAGMLDRRWLDRCAPDRPIRIQHRSGRMWFLNSAALERLLASGRRPPPGLDRETGRLFDEDTWAREALGGQLPDFTSVSRVLAAFGVTGVTEISPANDDSIAAHFADAHHRGALPQRVLMAGKAELGAADWDHALMLGPVKLHLHEAHLPDFDATLAAIRAAHTRNRQVAVHCVTLVELVFTLAAFREAGVLPGDRIEHAAIAPDDQIAEIAALGLAVVSQPHFIAERGDAYRADLPESEWPNLYRLRAFQEAGIALAAGSDAPFGRPDPWASMAAAVSRSTGSHRRIGQAEALSPEAALDLYLADPVDLGLRRAIIPGMPADLCLLTAPWAIARATLSADLVRATIIGGRLIHDRVDQTPGQRQIGADALA